jgi:hypothetical protein
MFEMRNDLWNARLRTVGRMDDDDEMKNMLT